MADYQFIDQSDDYTDLLVDAGFERPLLPPDIVPILHVISEVVVSKAASGTFFEGLAALEVNEGGLKIRFRFSRKPEHIASLNEIDRDELPRKRAHFVIHLFAKIDSIYRLGEVPFPPDFREFLKLPD